MVHPEVHVNKPCSQPWNNMNPDAEGKFCSACNKNVLDFSKSTFEEFKAKYETGGDSICGRFSTTADGRIVFRGNSDKMYWLRAACLALLLTFGSTLFNMSEADAQVVHDMRKATISYSDEHTTDDIYVKVLNRGKAVAETRVIVRADDGQPMEFTTDKYGRFVFSLPVHAYINVLEFEVDEIGKQTYTADCKASALAGKKIGLKYRKDWRKRHTMGRVVLGCPSF